MHYMHLMNLYVTQHKYNVMIENCFDSSLNLPAFAEAIVWHSPCILCVSIFGSRGHVPKSQSYLQCLVQIGTEVRVRHGQAGSQTLYKFVKHD